MILFVVLDHRFTPTLFPLYVGSQQTLIIRASYFWRPPSCAPLVVHWRAYERENHPILLFPNPRLPHVFSNQQGMGFKVQISGLLPPNSRLNRFCSTLVVSISLPRDLYFMFELDISMSGSAASKRILSSTIVVIGESWTLTTSSTHCAHFLHMSQDMLLGLSMIEDLPWSPCFVLLVANALHPWTF